MSSISAEVKVDLITAITASATISPFSLSEPVLAEVVWSDLDHAPDSHRVEFLHDGRQALSTAYYYYMKQRVHSFESDIYDTIHQNLFTRSVFRLLLMRAQSTLDDSTQVSTQLFLFFVAGLARSLSSTDFTAWFAGVFGPLISVAEVVLFKALGLEGNHAGDMHKDKKARLEQESKFHRSYTLFHGVRALQADARARQIEGGEGSTSVIPAETATVGPRSESCNSVHRIKRLASKASKQIRRAVSALAQVSSTSMSPPLFAATFAPRLDPKPRLMPGAWTLASTPSPPAAALAPVPSLPAILSHSQDARSDAFSRFPRRSASTAFKVQHFCPLVSSFKP
ncbi:hypothetical protein DFH09DRAFT_1358446 [Mycena vulgaris]|nr:hypothetical protein DFH09DRAFT_1358446 [Mycena vulgaris]